MQTAEDFASWMAALGNKNEPTLSKNTIKQLFSIGVEGESSRALYVEPRLRNAVPDEVAQSLKMPTVFKYCGLFFSFHIP